MEFWRSKWWLNLGRGLLVTNTFLLLVNLSEGKLGMACISLIGMVAATGWIYEAQRTKE